MTEKRFMIIGENYTNIDMPLFVVCREDDCCFEVYESKEDAQMVCDKLNNLVDENEQLKSEVYDWKVSAEDYLKLGKSLKKENEQLKSENQELRMSPRVDVNEIESLVCENEQLKQTMQEVAELLSEEVDLFSDKATEHDIFAYVELQELDNKDAYYMAISTKKAIKMLKGDVE